MSASERAKGARIEREIVNLHAAIGVHAERYPLSGGSHYQGKNHDVNIYPFGINGRVLRAEVKGRKDGSGTKMFDRWLAGKDMVITKADRAKPTVHLTWDAYANMMKVLANFKHLLLANDDTMPPGEARPYKGPAHDDESTEGRRQTEPAQGARPQTATQMSLPAPGRRITQRSRS